MNTALRPNSRKLFVRKICMAVYQPRSLIICQASLLALTNASSIKKVFVHAAPEVHSLYNAFLRCNGGKEPMRSKLKCQAYTLLHLLTVS